MPQNQSSGIDPAASSIPLYATQGGGYATWKDNDYVWHSDIPEYLPDAKVGDPIPDEWDVVPVNEAARREEIDFSDDGWYGYDARLEAGS